MNKFKKGFTLAEILITLTIMGVIAALVIPTIVNTSGDLEDSLSVKKTYSFLSDAMAMIQANNRNFQMGNTSFTNDMLRNSFCSVLTCIKMGTATEIFGLSSYKWYKGVDSGWPLTSTDTTPSVILNNGNFVKFTAFQSCDNVGVNACARIEIDGNGKIGPNMIGRDLFSYWIISEAQPGSKAYYSVYPVGVTGDTESGLPGGCTAGAADWTKNRGCTAYRINNPNDMP